ncbi:hypothetical protein LINGRAHAP2_LOCUS25476 [Linum grandiflorum]
MASSTTKSAAVWALIFLLAVAADARVFPEEFFPEIKTTNILLPSERPTELDSPAAALKNLPVHQENQQEEKEAPMTTTMVRFHPINRHFSARPMDRFRHNCRHGQSVNRLRPLTPRYGRIREIPYGGDVILPADDQQSGFSAGTPHREFPYGNDVISPADDKDRSSTAGTRHRDSVPATNKDSGDFTDWSLDVPLRWTEIGYESPKINLKDDILPAEAVTPQLRRHHRHRLGRFEKNFGVERHQNEENAIVKKIRKFLNHF